MTDSEVANIIHVVESIENIMRIAEKNPKAFNIDSLRRSREMALAKLDEAKAKYRTTLSASPAGVESVTLKAYRS
jgi:hypothetical protein